MGIIPIKLRLSGDKKAKKGLKGVSGSVKSLGASALKLGVAYFGARGIISGFSQSVKLAGQQELAEKKLAQAFGKSTDGLIKHAQALQQKTMYGDEDIIMMQSMLASFTKNEDEIKQLTDATLDLASGMGIDLKSAGDLVAKTVGSSTNAMSRYGVEVTGAVGSTERMESLTKNVANLFGGQASAQAQTFSGAVQQMKNALGDAGEELGFILTPALQEGAGWIKTFAEKVGGMFEFLQKVDWKATGEALKSNLSGLLDTIGEQLHLNFDMMVLTFKNVFSKISPIMGQIWVKVIDALKSVASLIWEPIWVSLQHIGIKIQNGFTAIINGIKTVINELIEKVNILNPFQDIPTIALGDYVETESLTTKLSETGIAEGLSKLFANDQDIENISDYQAKSSELWSNYFSGIVKMSDDTTDKQKKGIKGVAGASKKSAKTQTDAQKEVNKTYADSLSAVRSQIKGYLSQAIAGMIAKEVGSKGLYGLATATAGAILVTSLFESLIPSFAKGGSMLVSGKQLMMVGDNATGMERVTVDPIGTPSSNTSGNNITVNISAPLVDETVRDSILPSIQNALNLNLA